jgi:hypothetical protein
MLRWPAVVCALTVFFIVIAETHDPAVAASAATRGTSASGNPALGAGRRAAAAPPSRAASHAGSAVQPGGSAPGRSPRDPGSGVNGGWFQRGFGGTRDPGWGYRFGPSLGGFGR